MTWKIFRSILLVAGSVLLASLLVILGVLYDYFGGVRTGQLEDELDLAAAAVEADGADYLARVTSDRFRLTWIAADGTVLCDTAAAADTMENHAGREEFQQALATGVGQSTHYSSTLLEKTAYYARRLSDGTVLRISSAYATVGLLLLGMLQPSIVILMAALILSGLLAYRLSRRIVEPLNQLDLDHPLENDTYDELAPLLGRIDRQHKEIDRQLSALRRKNDEFDQVTASMAEGLVLLDKNGTVLSINPAARQLFGTDGSAVGQSFLTVDRSHDMSMAVQAALADGHSELRAERGGREYQFDLSRIQSGGQTLGCVILTFDVTEQEFAERSRREFTANVSHELKTPLQGIMGSAELIEAGMVKPEDMPRFIGHIRQEAARLVNLIEDIIRLSQLDEARELPCEDVDLLALAQGVERDLAPAAGAKHVALSLSGGGASIHGVRRLLYEIVYNLCDNAIKYNVEGGQVNIDVTGDGKNAAVTVKDTGIGIPPEHQDRVFERFYRVDKSHSKASGGTGLGLSIVKHAVQYHHGTIALTSEPGKGTAITVTFPLQEA